MNAQPADEIVLSSGVYGAYVSSYGASLRGLWMESPDGRQEILWGYSGIENKRGGQGDVLIPFPGRIAGGTYSFEGHRHQLEKNDKEGPNAIHGFVRARDWEAGSTQTTAIFRTRIREEEFAPRGYPFSIEVQLKYSLSESGLTCEFTLRNFGRKAAPVGAGFHPYFTVGTETADEMLVEIPASDVLDFNDRLLPTGRILSTEATPLDFKTLRTLGNLKLNHCFGGFRRESNGHARVRVKNPRTNREVAVWMDSNFQYLVAYTGDALGPLARKALALEPMTCATDAFNHPDWGLKVLEPGQSWSGKWGVSAS